MTETVQTTLITVLGGLLTIAITAIMNTWQNRKNKMVDVRIEEYKQQTREKAKEQSDNIGQTYGDLWNLLYKYKFDRVYVVRPHPENKHEFLSVQLEVKKNGVSSTKTIFRDQPMDEMPQLCGIMTDKDYVIIKDTLDETIIQDVAARSIFARNGTNCAIIAKLKDADDRWIGSIFCTSMTQKANLEGDDIRKDVLDTAAKIQLIIPPYKEFIV